MLMQSRIWRVIGRPLADSTIFEAPKTNSEGNFGEGLHEFLTIRHNLEAGQRQ